MKSGAVSFAVSAVLIMAAWWWLGRPIAMPVAPLHAGQKLECLSYAPFRGTQTPIDLTLRIEHWQIEEDLRQLSAITGCIRSYSVHLGLDQIVPIAQRIGLKVMLGLWLGRETALNRVQIETTVALANRYPDAVRAIVVGNEVLLRGELSAAALAAAIREVKSRVTVPVTYADVWEFWLRNPEVVSAVDFVTIHILPYWEDLPIPVTQAADHVASIRRRVAESFPGKDIMIGEFGWPSAGRMREGALPSPSNQAKALQEVIARAMAEGFHLNVIEAYDQPWKRKFEGTVGGHWGLLDGASRQPKFAWGEPVSDHPGWRWQAVAGIALALAVVAAGIAAGGGSRGRRWSWVGITVNATIAGIMIGWAGENVPLESLGIGGWTYSLVMLALAAIAPVAGAAALARGQATPALARVLARAPERPKDGLTLLLGGVLAVLIVMAIETGLGLVFDPRYRDFPVTPLTAAVVPYAILAIAHAGIKIGRALAETAAAAVLAPCAIYIVFNETWANWQAVWLAGVLLLLSLSLSLSLSLTLTQSRAAQG